MLGLGTGGGTNRRKSALLIPNWFDDVAEYRLKKALVSRHKVNHTPKSTK